VEVTPKGAQRSGAPRRGAVDGTSTALHSKHKGDSARRRPAGLPPRNVLDYWWGVPPCNELYQVGAATTRDSFWLKLDLSWPPRLGKNACPVTRGRGGSHRTLRERSPFANDAGKRKSAFSRFAPVHRADLM
jgi:hypothetical protein